MKSVMSQWAFSGIRLKTVAPNHVHSRIHEKAVLGLLLDPREATAFFKFANAVRNLVVLERRYEREIVIILGMKRNQFGKIRLNNDVAVGDEHVVGGVGIQGAQRSSGAARLGLFDVANRIFRREFFEERLKDFRLVVDRKMEAIETEGQKLIDDDLDDSSVSHGNQRLGKNVGKRSKARALSPCHDHDGEFELSFGVTATSP